MITSGRAGIGKQSGQALAIGLIKAFALGHHVGFGMAELWWRTCWSRGKGPSLKVFFDFARETWRYAPLLDLAIEVRGRGRWRVVCPSPCVEDRRGSPQQHHAGAFYKRYASL